jgi:acylpyruvate hydrolase
MRLVTFRTEDGTRAGRVEGDQVVELPFADVGALLAGDRWPERARGEGERRLLEGVELAQLVAQPSKVICVGLNYLLHIQEGTADVPDYPTFFAKYADALTGPRDAITIPLATDKVDWEAELVIVVGRTVRNADEAEAAEAIAGFTVGNDLSMRDWQRRTLQWLQGKTWEKGSPIGPALVTPDELGGVRPDLRISCEVDAELMQDARTSSLLFDPVKLVSYASTIVTLRPGDLFFTGTPEGVGAGRTPPVFLKPGQVMTTRIEGIGELINPIVPEGGVD